MKVRAFSRPLSLVLYNNSHPLPRFPLLRPVLFQHAASSSNSPTQLNLSVSMSPCIDSCQLSQEPNRPPNCRPSFSDRFSCIPTHKNLTKTMHTLGLINNHDDQNQDLWLKMQDEARSKVEQEPILSNYYFTSILSHKSLESALANLLSVKLSSSSLPGGTLYDIFIGVLVEDQGVIIEAVRADLRAVKERDPACISYVHCLLNFKGFIACQAHRIAHKLWSQGRKVLALMIQNRVSEVFAVDIHPGAKIGSGILLDHATGVVIGETAVVGDNVSILHNVTLGGTGKASGDRHPKIGDGVLIGAGTSILGNIRIGEGAKIGAGSVVLKDVPARTTAVGNPARLVGGKQNPVKLDKIPSFTMDQTSHIREWSDYVI
ncbi:serine acetyltransferase 1, chloroplastic-like [Mangifera indica]|uniref:serine acetyltransferase 1, chloroplastic-like n=1 Tax=Mangifera indica TaxID=29780 RepID=UPI001CFC29BE|nr:serine acetyltransferase 1, chloroplastic-like [Mangifera indica]